MRLISRPQDSWSHLTLTRRLDRKQYDAASALPDLENLSLDRSHCNLQELPYYISQPSTGQHGPI